ncbi:hypothetical protein ACRYCC_15475 [Actinomadura scrupuli]|uniref:hypothetical protein n=1 Tax=Actinomadura scrupuli TaxID=559629 RepID=UPI003D973BDC
MIDLTDELLKPTAGTICYWPADLDHPVAGTWDIRIPLAPFSADDEYEPATFRPGTDGPELVSTEIMLDFIALPAGGTAALSRRTFTFPVKPEEGHIDGSIYLIAAHCPVEVTRIEFGTATPDQIKATLHAHFDFDAVGGVDIRNRTAVLRTVLRFELGKLFSHAIGSSVE